MKRLVLYSCINQITKQVSKLKRPTLWSTPLFAATIVLLLICSLHCTSFAAKNVSKGYSIINFNKTDYLADSQNWSVTISHKGIIYSANSKGLLEFDGINWKLYSSPNENIIRAVKSDKNNRIYSCGYREIGYWETNDFGLLQYTSLTPAAQQYFKPNSEFWSIGIVGEKVFFHSFTQIYIYENGQFQVIELPRFSNSLSQIGNKIIIDQPNGLFEVENGTIEPFLTHRFFNNKQVRFVFQREDGSLLVGTNSHGLFRYNNENFIPLSEKWNQFFSQNSINRGLLLNDSLLVTGTILKGIAICNLYNLQMDNLQIENGLQNNTVLGITNDKTNNLWLALDRGIAYINFRKPSAVELVPVKGVGAVYSTILFNEKLYLGTNQGLYIGSLSDPAGSFTLVENSQGQVWTCKAIGNQMLIGHNNGLFTLSDNKLKAISTQAGVFDLVSDPANQNLLIQSTYNNLVTVGFESGRASHITTIDNFSELIQYLEIDPFGYLWAGHMHKAVFQLKLNDERNRVERVKYFGKDSPFKKENGIHPYTIEGQIVFTTGTILYTYNYLNDSIVPFEALNSKLGEAAKADRIFSAPEHHYWLISRDNIFLFRIDNKDVKLIKKFPKALFNNLCIDGFENIFPIDSHQAILTLENGYALLNAATTAEPTDHDLESLSPLLKTITVSERNQASKPLNINTNTFKIPSNKNNAKLNFYFPGYSGEKLKFTTFLEGMDKNWRSPSESWLFEFERLPAGVYTLRAKAINSWGKESKPLSIKLTILPPWYLTPTFKLSALVVSLLALYLFRRQIVRNTQKEILQKQNEKDRELINLKNERLQDEISFKSQELANSTLSVIRKNEFLMELKRILRSQKEILESRFPDKYYQYVVDKIDDNISGSENWKAFEKHFERAHETYIRKLKAKFPQLTPSDLRICSYLKMNLTSKEIAPLLGISVRGVENHRYRIRKKMGLAAETNLNELLLNI